MVGAIVLAPEVLAGETIYLNMGIRVSGALNKVAPVIKNGYYGGKNFIYDPKNIQKSQNFLDGFQSKYPKPEVKFPFVNSHTTGFIVRKIIDAQ
jgi:hypothetical protein